METEMLSRSSDPSNRDLKKALRIFRSPVSNVRHIARSVRIYRTTRTCTVRSKGYEAYQDGAAAEDDCGCETRYP